MKRSLTVLGLVIFSLSSLAIAHSDDTSPAMKENLSVSGFSIQEIPDPVLPHPVASPSGVVLPIQPIQPPQTNTITVVVGDIGGITSAISDIVNAGKAVWSIIQANKPTANVTSNSADAIPASVKTWTDLQDWEAPQSHLYNVVYKNELDMDVINFTFRLMYTPGGNLGGAGQFLSNVTIVPADLSVDWAYNFAADVKVYDVTNAGSGTAPIAALTIQLHWVIETTFSHVEKTNDFYVEGNGQFIQLD